MRVIDLTQPIEPKMSMFPIDPQPVIFEWTTIKMHGFSTKALFMVEHTGTHVDAPSHFIKNGKTVDQLDLDVFRGDAVILDLQRFSANAMISAKDIQKSEQAGTRIRKNDIVLVRTGWDKLWKKPEYLARNPGLSADAAQYLRKKQVKLVGIDTPNIDHPDAENFPVHNTLLSSNIPIIENICNLVEIGKNRCEFVALPLRIKEGTGSPVRAVAITA